MLLCSDGLWAGLKDDQLATLGQNGSRSLRDNLADLGARAVSNTAPFADNTTAAAVRWLGA